MISAAALTGIREAAIMSDGSGGRGTKGDEERIVKAERGLLSIALQLFPVFIILRRAETLYGRRFCSRRLDFEQST